MARGDHVYVSRVLYTHHGIDAGDGSVIHFTGEPGTPKINAGIARTPMADFLKGGELKIRRYGRRDDVETTMRRAESRVGETGYHLVVNNCEHFATWCCTGRTASEQVRGVGGLTAHGAVSAAALSATGGVVAAAGTVQGLSAAGIMSGLAAAGSSVGAGAAAGPAAIGAIPALASIGITQVALRDDESLTRTERQARRDGRVASVAGAGGATVGGLAAMSAAGTTAGLSAAGISSGLAAIGATVGGGMIAGAAVLVAAPAVAAAGAATGVYLLSRRLRRSAAPVDAPVVPTDELRTCEGCSKSVRVLSNGDLQVHTAIPGVRCTTAPERTDHDTTGGLVGPQISNDATTGQ